MLAEKEAVLEAPFRVTDLKQWVYCPRILYYVMCLPDVRPVTYKMKAGVEAGREEEGREARRSLHAYNLTEGRREFNVPLVSSRLGLRGVVDMVIWLDEPAPGEVMPVDYKLSEIVGEHFRLQLAA
ncbi:MAG: CRISPR-associated protein Cas4, partial [Chloroflexi bacterium CG_4_10_14_0_8_um_filter_57_5]